ncbi:histidine kinase dimerization/phosphoacceptor domain -containing protein [Coleofasciculus sp. FACHB-1120]|uniref:histidine kinase dimerization/phosphoacceptor domain -containing protein n=1 Tax=Coleofasciculus sp. FACHB-1120 TaxID=2692783 RepID=UPI00168514B4|nr:histidine kinase dimerization/phosphoacceptor domain -containing protein [Coleofasciculus sp. FACHB-1120]MBD2744641.1 CBS domain-containing protein [Coleofasciculus sp. FACHB-1120]
MPTKGLLSLESVIDRRPLTVSPDTLVIDAIAMMGKAKSSCVLPSLKIPPEAVLMSEARASSVFVVDGLHLLGVFTHTDAIRIIASEINLAEVKIASVMTQPSIALTESDIESDTENIFTALLILRQHQIRHLPVVDVQKQVVGVITLESIRQALPLDELIKSQPLIEAMTASVIQAPATASALSLAQLMAEHQVNCVVLTEETSELSSIQDSKLQPKPLSEANVQTSKSASHRYANETQNVRPTPTLTIPLNAVGIVIERDIIDLQALSLDLSQIQAFRVMNAPVLSLSPSDSVLVALWEMQQHQVQRVVVSDNGRDLLGIVTQTSFLQTLDLTQISTAVERLQQSITQFEAESSVPPHNETLEPQGQESPAELLEQLERNRLLTTIALRIHQSLNLDEILNTAVAEVRQFLQTDRVIIYRFNPDLSGTVVVESVAEGWQPALSSTIHDNCFGKNYAQSYKKGRIQVTEDIYTAGLTQCHIDILALYDIRGSLVVPILQGEHLWGLLCAYHCSGPRRWREFEIDLLKQLSTQVAIAIQQSELYQQVQAELAERKRAEEQLKASLKEKEVLLKEIHHRVKNNLQIISSLLKLQSAYTKEEQVLGMFKDSQNRIRSMALIHEKLYQSKDLSRIDFAEYIHDLARNLLRSYKASSQAITLKTTVNKITLNIDTAIPCGLIINELMSNSLKHAFPTPSEDNEICINIYSSGNHQFILSVSDNGIGFPTDLDFRNTESLGLELVCTLTEQLDGTIELDSSKGTSFNITFSEIGNIGRHK